MANSAFYQPHDYGCFDLGDSQTETPSITFDQAVVTPRIVVYSGSNKIKVYTEGDGITVSGDRLTVSFSFNGADFARFTNSTIKVDMQFFVVGRVEYIMSLKIVKTMIGV